MANAGQLYQGQYLGRQFGTYRLVKLLGEGGLIRSLKLGGAGDRSSVTFRGKLMLEIPRCLRLTYVNGKPVCNVWHMSAEEAWLLRRTSISAAGSSGWCPF